MNTDNQPKKKVSAFEYVFMKAYAPEKAKEHEAHTEQEELKQIEDNLSEQFSKMRIKHEG